MLKYMNNYRPQSSSVSLAIIRRNGIFIHTSPNLLGSVSIRRYSSTDYNALPISDDLLDQVCKLHVASFVTTLLAWNHDTEPKTKHMQAYRRTCGIDSSNCSLLNVQIFIFTKCLTAAARECAQDWSSISSQFKLIN
jgi:hypothetical protein